MHMDQTYCISDQTIMDNLFIIRDVLEICKVYTHNVRFLSLDQGKAFNRIVHNFCFLFLKLLILERGERGI